MSLGALWDQSKSAVADLVEVASRSWRDVVADDLLARQEFAKAGELTREGLREFAEGGASRSATGNVVGGAALGLGAAASFVFPSGRGARVVGSGRGVARRAAAGVGDAFAGEGGRVSRASGGDVGADVAAEMLRESVRPGSGVDAGPLVGRSGEPARLLGDVSVDDFERAITEVRKIEVTRPGGPTRSLGETVYQYPTKEYGPMRRYLSDDGLSGFAIKPDGDLVSVFSAPGLGRGGALVDAAVARGARKLDAFDEDGFLPQLYGSRGFVEVKREPWDPEQKPDNWRGGEPDVVYMELRNFPGGRISGESAAPLMEGQPLEGDTVLGAVMSPVSASRQFGATSGESAQRIFEEMAKRGPLNVVSRDDLKTAGMLEYLDALSANIKAGKVDLSADYPDFRQFQPFLDDLGLQKPKLITNKRGQTFRPLLKAIEDGRYDEVLDDLAVQINNVFTLLDDDVFTLAFYPYMHNATVSGAARTGTPPSFLSALSGVLSAGAAPLDEAGAVRAVFDWGKAATRVRGDKLVQVGGDLKKYQSASQAYVQLVNNPDWLSNRVIGLASKTYVYSMLKMNPRMVRALVIDRVDSSARLGAFELNAKKFPKEWAWQTENALTTQGPELALGGFAERVVASALGIPPSAVQENVWAIWRVLRDLRAGNGPSRQSGVISRSGKTIEDFMAEGKMPKPHRELLEQNIARLEAEVASNGPASRYWETHTLEATGQTVLVPRTNMPVDGFLPPAIRTPDNVAALSGAIGNAEEIGKGLAVNAPWAPIALQLSVIGGVGGAALGAGQGVAQASDGEGVTLASGMGFLPAASAGAGVGAGLGLTAGLTLKGVGALVRRTISPKSQKRLKPFHIGVSPDGVEIPPIATNYYDEAQRIAFRRNFSELNKFDFEQMSDLRNVVSKDVSDTNIRMSSRNFPMQKYEDENVFASVVSETIIEPSYEPLGVNNLYESVIYWNNVGNKNIQSVLRTGDLSSDEFFVRALNAWELNYPNSDIPMSRMSSGEVVKYFEEITEKSIKFIEDAMRESTHPDFIAYRGVNGYPMRNFLGEDFVRALESNKSSVIGAEITDPGFLATSLNASDASGFASKDGNYGYVWQFKVPENFDALPISGNWERPGVGLPNPGEYEVILPKNLTLEIVDVQTPQDVFRAFNPDGFFDKFVNRNTYEIRYDDSVGFFKPWLEGYGFSIPEGIWANVPNGLITFKIKGT